ncbi:MAG: hypothetical protein ABI844_06285 [Saprospiraceae bacterium]
MDDTDLANIANLDTTDLDDNKLMAEWIEAFLLELDFELSK